MVHLQLRPHELYHNLHMMSACIGLIIIHNAAHIKSIIMNAYKCSLGYVCVIAFGNGVLKYIDRMIIIMIL